MKILLLAPEPFYIERGTPIAVDLVLQALSARGDQVDMVTYHLGKDMQYEHVKIHRIPKVSFIREIRPGFSWRKVFCDVLMGFKVLKLSITEHFDLVHAVEEAVFFAMLLKLFFRIPYVYDMDSSLSQQMVERYPRVFTPFASLMNFIEGIAIRHAKAVVPVCDALSIDAQKFNPEKIIILRDISLLSPFDGPADEDLRAQLGIQGPMMMYVGNLESYQGIDLLLESFALAIKRKSPASLVVIGGKREDVQHYQEKAERLGIQARVHFLGPKPVDRLAAYLAQADILVSPRVKGKNTPMKVYSYLDSGKALLATNLPTHTQVLNNKVAMLVDPTPELFSSGVQSLSADKNLRLRLGGAGKKLIAEKHSHAVFNESVNALYDWLKAEIGTIQAQPRAKTTRSLRSWFGLKREQP